MYKIMFLLGTEKKKKKEEKKKKKKTHTHTHTEKTPWKNKTEQTNKQTVKVDMDHCWHGW